MDSQAQADGTDEKTILSMFHGMWQNRCISVLVGLRIPEILCISDKPSMSVHDVAREAGCNSSDQLYPIMRVLAQWGIGIEHPNKHFSKNRALELLRRDSGPGLGHMVAYFCSDENWAAMLALPEAVKKGTPAFKLEHGMSHFDYMNKEDTLPYDPTKMRVGCSKNNIGSKERRKEYIDDYKGAMVMSSEELELLHPSFADRSIFHVYPWASCSRLLEIGGSTGLFLSSILKLPGCEHIQGIMMELPAFIEKARSHIKDLGVKGRVQLVSHDCFDPFPELPFLDTIMAKNFAIMFNNEQLTKLLENCHAVLASPGGRLLFLEPYLAEPGDTSHRIAANGLQGGFENIHVYSTAQGTGKRSKSEWIEYLGRICCNSGFQLNNVYDTAPGGMMLFEMITV